MRRPTFGPCDPIQSGGCGRLQRLRLVHRVLDREVLARDRRLLLGPHRLQDARGVGHAVEALADLRKRVLVGVELVLLPPRAEADVDAPAADDVDAGADLREVAGVAVERAGDELARAGSGSSPPRAPPSSSSTRRSAGSPSAARCGSDRRARASRSRSSPASGRRPSDAPTAPRRLRRRAARAAIPAVRTCRTEPCSCLPFASGCRALNLRDGIAQKQEPGDCSSRRSVTGSRHEHVRVDVSCKKCGGRSGTSSAIPARSRSRSSCTTWPSGSPTNRASSASAATSSSGRRCRSSGRSTGRRSASRAQPTARSS